LRDVNEHARVLKIARQIIGEHDRDTRATGSLLY
jgi:hypothetical protein